MRYLYPYKYQAGERASTVVSRRGGAMGCEGMKGEGKAQIERKQRQKTLNLRNEPTPYIDNK
jgi:hypothetical protein